MSEDIMKPLAPELIAQLLQLKAQIETCAHGESSALVAGYAQTHGYATQTVWRWLRDHAGYTSGRKKRADAGQTRLSTETLQFIAASKSVSVRLTGKSTKPTAVAMNVADANGFEVNVSASRINTLLRQNRMDAKAQVKARNHGELRSLYPNHVHQIDPSLCLVFYLGGKQRIMTVEQFNKNKPTSMDKVKLKVWRYVRYDHASGTLDVRYFEAAGENQNVLFEFLMWTWGKQPHRQSYGIPAILLWDKGSANTSAAVCRLLDALGVQHQTHATHHAWVKGGVENGNNIVETHFESRLRDEPVDNIEQLNAAAQNWVRDYNANAIKFVDCRVRRMDGKAHVRDDLWQHIQAGQLITLPERKVCAWFMHGRIETRTVTNCRVSFAHPQCDGSQSYDLKQWAEFLANGEKVKVTPLLLGTSCDVVGAIRVEIERLAAEPLIVEVSPTIDFDAFGRPTSAPVIGAEYRSAPDTAATIAAKQIAQTAYGVATLDEAEAKKRDNARPFAHLNGGKGAVAHSHLGKEDLPIRMPRPAQTLDTPAIAAAQTAQVDTVRLTHTQAAIQLKQMLGRNLTTDEYTWMRHRYADGIYEAELSTIARHYRGEVTEQATGTHSNAKFKVLK